MSPQHKETVTNMIAGGVIGTILGPLVFALLTGGWSAKESVAAHTADVVAIRAEVQRIKDVVCLDHQDAPQCKP